MKIFNLLYQLKKSLIIFYGSIIAFAILAYFLSREQDPASNRSSYRSIINELKKNESIIKEIGSIKNAHYPDYNDFLIQKKRDSTFLKYNFFIFGVFETKQIEVTTFYDTLNSKWQLKEYVLY